MTWYTTGTVTVTNGSAIVTGSGTAWAANVRQGWVFQGPDGRAYQVLAVVSDTQITLARNYAGSTLAGQQYDLFPTQGEIRDLAAQAAALMAAVGAMVNGAGAGKFSAGTAALPGVAASTDLDTGIAWLAANVLGISAGGSTRLSVGTTDIVPTLPVRGAAGSAAAPSLSFSGDTDTGLFSAAANAIAVSTAGTERVRVDNAALTFGGDLVYSKTDLRIYPPTADGADTSRLVMLGGGAWSVTRGAQLVLAGNEHASAGGWVLASGTGGTGALTASGGLTVEAGAAGSIFNNNVGINTLAPASAELHVRGAGEVMRTEGTAARGSGNVFNTFHDPTGRKGYVGYGSTVDDDFYINNEMNAAVRLYTNGAERARIDAPGHLIRTPPTAAPTFTANGQMAIYPTSNTNVRVSYRGTDGVTRVGNIPLAPA